MSDLSPRIARLDGATLISGGFEGLNGDQVGDGDSQPSGRSPTA